MVLRKRRGVGTTMKSALDRFTEKYVVNEETGCWEWTSHIVGSGYAGFYFEGKVRRAHRLSFAWANGFLPDLDIDHLCRVRHCVNPDHLEAVSRRENSRRGIKGVLTTHCPSGHEYSGGNLYVDPKGHRRCRSCRREGMRKYA